MTIGLSRSAKQLLAQLAEAQQAGAQHGVSESQLWFTVSVGAEQTTAEFAAVGRTILTHDPNAIIVLLANRLIERFATIAPDPAHPRYRVTQAGTAIGARVACGT